jgi:hypothetical protein
MCPTKTFVSSHKAKSGQMFDFKDLILMHGMEVFKHRERPNPVAAGSAEAQEARASHFRQA